MTPPTPDNLEQQLRELTTWKGEPTQLWEKALDDAGSDTSRPPAGPFGRRARSIFSRPIGGPVLLGVAACVIAVCMAAVLVPNLSGVRRSASHRAVPSPLAQEAQKAVEDAVATRNRFESPELFALKRSIGQEGDQQVRTPASDPATRHVIQKATIELQTPDVRAAFAKANHLISVAGGEFVENSSLTGEGKSAQANLTLRVAAARLSDVLNKLRELGEVKSENTTGEDVTSQVVDLEARIRNEQRIEKELLELLDKRADAPLKDILELRASLSTVRQTIERYIAQRDGLDRLVSLASILVVIRAEPESQKPAPVQPIGSYFTGAISAAWHGGLRTASDSISWLVELLVSGVVWWIFLAAIALSIHRYRRRLAARCV